ncbi:hypothetical protein L218DRAFT_1076497 [Marasmius fiardii PR-910]|nr:hypothetical protein L218DRAFT_1076497 [Marasmius fiardii PR-910]
MKDLTGLPLDDEILYHTLTFLSDFETLKSAILTSKSFHNIYDFQPTAVRRAVAENMVGGGPVVLERALEVVRYDRPISGDEDLSETEDEDANDTPTEKKGFISKKEINELIEIAKKFQSFEDVFSLRHKNRRFKQSQLTSVESFKFQRALYTLFLYCKKFSSARQMEERDLELSDDELATERTKRTKFLRNLSTEELQQIHTVSCFLIEVIWWAQQCQMDGDMKSEDLTEDKKDVYLSVGPVVIYECYDEGSIQPLHDDLNGHDLCEDPHPLLKDFLSSPLLEVCTERKASLAGIWHWLSILDDTEGENDTCSRCDEVQGFDLWGRTTYGFLYQQTTALRPATGLVTLLKSQLPHNQIESRYFGGTITKMPDAESIYEQVVEELLDSDYKQAEFEDWQVDDWLCTGCLTRFLKENLHLWLLDKRIQAGDDVPKKDCWYGWDCRTQRHNVDHARKLNHICEPTRTK